MIRVRTLANRKLATGGAVEPPVKGTRRWVEVVAPTDDDIAALCGGLGLHELALEDALRVGHPPKLEEFDDHLFVIASTPVTDEDLDTRKIAIFLAKDWIVTVLRVPLERLDGIEKRVERDPARYLNPPAFLAHTLLDDMTDGFESRVDGLSDSIDALEDDLENSGLMARILDLRRQVSGLVRVVRSQRDMAGSLARLSHASIPAKIDPYLRDVYDHLVRVYDLLEACRDSLGAARDAHMAAVNNRLSETMRVLTVIATIMMPLSLLAGVYGMNFEIMPGTSAPAGFWILMVAMGLIAVGMLAWFRRRNWL